MVIFGTRPEAIKLYSVIKEFKKHKSIELLVVNTGQHLELANQMIKTLKIPVDIEMALMSQGQTPSDLASRLHHNLQMVMQEHVPDLVIVQGDTTTAFIGATTAYYNKIPVAHVEAGLRTHNLYNPFPEEGNRRMISQIASYNFAPTELAKRNLLEEGGLGEVYLTGNTGIDTLMQVASKINLEPQKQVLVTLHRRESFGTPLMDILEGIDMFLEACPKWSIVFPVHPNPNVQESVFKKWGQHKRKKLIKPLDYRKMIRLMKESMFILTDSGGIQEEAPSLKRPVLVAREYTERPEGIDAEVAMLVGTDKKTIADTMIELAKGKDLYKSMIKNDNPFGDGKAAERIIEELLKT